MIIRGASQISLEICSPFVSVLCLHRYHYFILYEKEWANAMAPMKYFMCYLINLGGICIYASLNYAIIGFAPNVYLS